VKLNLLIFEMNMTDKKTHIWIYWVVAFALTFAIAYYQRVTGPTYDKKVSFTFRDQEYKFKLPRTHVDSIDCPIILIVKDTAVSAELVYKRYKLNEEYTEVMFKRIGDTLTASLPKQPAAGKLEYSIVFSDKAGKDLQINGNETVVIRFKGGVPTWIVIVHVFFMFAGMFLSNITGFYAFLKHKSFTKYALITTIVLLIGGLILGPIVQKYAFGVFWSGIPFGWDLTDNKLLFAFLFWFVTLIFSWKKPRYWLGIVSLIVLMAMYFIPHSAMGSEFDYKTKKMGTSKELKL
jgi:hypothetical protein